ncbi:GRF zinc finger domain-containing protein [Lindgomyces ingoldianus]|uniref:GRF zinc finger domain-containing protein n=1 Tax=Lindgomyces ingoldianus TaxID=673940 RepID=A0ACB6RF90_9PLEO|nr:GRF zinc finger domain-containing protein [Lindgomyces ingoldianus]KAF2477782.1 GRF zinc finger domain-containing protein [Lindgomyces ingoldianus]
MSKWVLLADLIIGRDVFLIERLASGPEASSEPLSALAGKLPRDTFSRHQACPSLYPLEAILEMDIFISRKRRPHSGLQAEPGARIAAKTAIEEESTDFKLALLASLHPTLDDETLLEVLLASQGSVENASQALNHSYTTSPRKRPATPRVGYQSSLASFCITLPQRTGLAKRPLTKRGKTLFLYTPEDIEAHTPCSIIHNFLPAEQADALLVELLEESPTYSKLEFKLFDRVVKSPHTFCFYVDSWDEAERQKTEYIYDGRKVDDVRRTLPEMRKASKSVEEAVNSEIQRRIRDFYPDGKKLKYQSPNVWKPNTAFVNCYDGPKECVGYHSDQLTYLGPRAVIGSLSLGVAREFRVRKIHVEDSDLRKDDSSLADAQGQISIHLPHNSLLIMHAEMQEEWKHSIAPAQAIDPHPLAKNKRLNITYRCYKQNLHPNYTPKCKCGVPTVLRCVTRKKENRGRYMWMCHTNYIPEQDGCSFFQWAVFDDDGEPSWATNLRTNAKNGEKMEGNPELTRTSSDDNRN